METLPACQAQSSSDLAVDVRGSLGFVPLGICSPWDLFPVGIVPFMYMVTGEFPYTWLMGFVPLGICSPFDYVVAIMDD